MSVQAMERYLTIEGAVELLRERGLEYSYRQMKRWATARKLPFFLGPDRKLIIAESDLIQWFEQRGSR